MLFAAAGRLDVPEFWAYSIARALITSGGLFLIDPNLRAERMRPGPGERDRWMRRLIFPLWAFHLAVAGLDVGRYHWSPPMPLDVQIAGLATLCAAASFGVWCTTINPFFSSAVRVQEERGQRVVESGPYGFLRHPGYAASCAVSLTSGVALGSLWSVPALLPFVALMIRRTRLEDRMLRTRLAGYEAYAQRVPYRLLPGVW